MANLRDMNAEGVTEMDDINFYAPSDSWEVDEKRLMVDPNAAWRDGELLVARKGAVLPDRCLKCNAPAEGYQFHRKLYWHSVRMRTSCAPSGREGCQFHRKLDWHNPFWILVFLISPVLFVIVYFIVRWQGSITVGLCPRHRSTRARVIGISWLIALTGIGSLIGGLVVSSNGTPMPLGLAPEKLTPVLILGGLLLLVVSMIGGVLGSRVLIPKRIDKQFIWLTKVSPEYLATFPTLMG
jgi:hypothetical protein